jgi:hypothetical protein
MEMEQEYESMAREFYYIDAMPGAGKTQYFVDQAAKLLTEGGTHILVYVAPTANLLAESLQRVRKKVGSKLSEQITMVVAASKLRPMLNGIPHPLLRDQPTTALNYLFGLITEEQYLKTPYAKGYSHSVKGSLKPGQVVMTTHEAFVRLNRLDATGNDFGLLKRMAVIFDEARGCVINPGTFYVPKGEWQKLWHSITPTSIDSESKVWRKRNDQPPIRLTKGDTPHNLFAVSDMASVARIKEIFGVPSYSLLPKYMKQLRRMFLEYRHGRGSVYLMCNAQLSDLYNPRPNTEKIVVQIVMRPTSLFDNYHYVILTSAFFTDSQMYHFLKKDGHTLTSLLDRKKLSPALKSIKSRSEKLRQAAVKRLYVSTLLVPERGPGTHISYVQNLTSNLIQNGMVVPRGLRYEASGTLDRSMSHDEVLLALADPDGRPVSDNPDVDAHLRDYAVPPLWVMMSEAARIFKRWAAKHLGENPRALLALNSSESESSRKWTPTNVRYLYVTRYILGHGILMRKAGMSDSDVYDASHRFDTSQTPIIWRKRLKEILFDRVDTSVFTVPSSPHLHGINKYAKMRAFVHLAALNPSPDMMRVYRLLIPDYNIDQDHSIENLVQTLYRTNLRDPDATESVLMIVPYEASAELLAEKIGVKKFMRAERGEPPLSVLHHVKEMSEESRTNQRMSVTLALQKYDPSMQAEVRTAQRRVVTARNRLKLNPSSSRIQATVKKWEAAFIEVQKRALIKKVKK